MTPWKVSAFPIGTTTGTALQPSSPWISSSTPKKSAPVRSILFTKASLGTSYFSDCSQTFSDCGCTPPTAQNRATAPSSTRRDRSTSTVKSTCPGVSIRVTWWPFQFRVVAALWMVMPRSRSWTMKSIVAAPSCTSPSLWVLPA